MKINAKTFAGVGIGLIAGYFLLKNKKPLYIGGMGLAGGILANLIFNSKNKKSLSEKTEKYIQETENDIYEENTKEVSLEEVPTVLPNLTETSPKDFFDIDLGFPQ